MDYESEALIFYPNNPLNNIKNLSLYLKSELSQNHNNAQSNYNLYNYLYIFRNI